MLFCDEMASQLDFSSEQENPAMEKIVALINSRWRGAHNHPRAVLFLPQLFLHAIVARMQHRATFETLSRMLHRGVTRLVNA
jgi:hypothetical protein